MRPEVRLENQLIAKRQELENYRAGCNDAADRVVIELDDDTAIGRPHLGALDHILLRPNLLANVIEARLGLLQFVSRVLYYGRFEVGDALIGARNIFLGIGNLAGQFAKIAGERRLRAL